MRERPAYYRYDPKFGPRLKECHTRAFMESQHADTVTYMERSHARLADAATLWEHDDD
jgi:hypothetical protein